MVPLRLRNLRNERRTTRHAHAGALRKEPGEHEGALRLVRFEHDVVIIGAGATSVIGRTLGSECSLATHLHTCIRSSQGFVLCIDVSMY